MSRAEEFEELRPLMFSLAYRLLSSVAEAEDVVQESWLRYQVTPTRPRSPKAFLTAVVTRLAIDVLRSARVRREQYVGDWLPEPLLTDPYDDPARSAELADSVSIAALLLLERLSPLERAVFVLRDVFGYDFADVAAAVGRSEAACRQLLVRARRHLNSGPARFEADQREREELASRFFEALRRGNVGGLEGLLAEGVRLTGDTGGKAPALARSIVGAEQVARLLTSTFRRLDRLGARSPTYSCSRCSAARCGRSGRSAIPTSSAMWGRSRTPGRCTVSSPASAASESCCQATNDSGPNRPTAMNAASAT